MFVWLHLINQVTVDCTFCPRSYCWLVRVSLVMIKGAHSFLRNGGREPLALL